MQIKDLGDFRAVTLLCALLAGCDVSGGGPGDSMDNAEHVADSYYQALKDKDFEKASGYFMNTGVKPQAAWRDELRDDSNKLGELQSYKLVAKQADSGTTANRYTLQYKTTYSKATAHETLVLFIKSIPFVDKGGPHKMQIDNLVIHPKGRSG